MTLAFILAKLCVWVTCMHVELCHIWQVRHTLTDWHVVMESVQIQTSDGLSLENDVSPFALVSDLYEFLCFSTNITGLVDNMQGTLVTWQAITVNSRYLCSAWKQIWSNPAYWGENTHAHTTADVLALGSYSSFPQDMNAGTVSPENIQIP